MASVIIGRTPCPDCGFEAAHVKKSEKCHYRFCPECGLTTHCKTPRQVADLLAKTRTEKAAPESAPIPVPVERAAAPAPAEPIQKPVEPTPPEPPRRRGLFS